MVAEFDDEEWNWLRSQERIRRCRLYAQEAIELGVRARPDAKQVYADLSRQWLALAMEIEKTTGTG